MESVNFIARYLKPVNKFDLMRYMLPLAFLTIQSVSTKAQTLITPGHKAIKTSLIKPGKFSMDYYSFNDAGLTKIGMLETEVTISDQKIHFKTTIDIPSSKTDWVDEVDIEENTCKPISRTSVRGNRTFSLSYADGLKGEETNKTTGNKIAIDKKIEEACFDAASYPLLISALPLKLGYKAVIPVYDYNAKDNQKTHYIFVLDVTSSMHTAPVTGTHEVWHIIVGDESSSNLYNYFVDKTTRKVWRVDMFVKETGAKFTMIDRETDYNPFTTTFDKERTLNLTKLGNSSILGEAFARDDRSRRDDKGIDISILNLNKKQFAPQGTYVLLIPYTDFYKEWLDINKKQSKIKGAKAIPLPKEAQECIKQTQVYDDKGHFEFTSLMPGEYMLFVSFEYEDYFPVRKETGRADVYVNGSYQGTEVYTGLFGASQSGNASIQKIVTIEKDGETIKVKLKKT